MTNKPPVILEIKEINTTFRNHYSTQTKNKYCFVLSCRIKGESLFFYNGETIKATRGDILFIPYGSSYSQATDREKVIYIHMDISDNHYGQMHIYKAKSSEEAERIADCFSEIASIWSEKKPDYYYQCMTRIYSIIANYNAIPFCNDSNIPTALFPAVNYIDEHFQNADFSLDKACEAAYISRTYFNKLFKASFHMTPVAYINQLKLSRAKNLLKSGLYSRSEIALLCGFKDVKNFYTFFKKQTHMTTKQYEKN